MMRMSNTTSNIHAPDSAFNDEWLSENPFDSPVGGNGGGDDDGLRLATNSPKYTGPESLAQRTNISDNDNDNDDAHDPYTITVDAYDDEENPLPESSPKGNPKGQNNYEVSAMQQKRRKRILIIGATALLVLLIAIIVGVVVRKNNKKGKDEGTSPIEDPNTNSTTSPNATIPPNGTPIDTEDNYFLPYLGDSDGIVKYLTKAGPFLVEIPTVDSSTVGVYQDEEEVRDGLSRMALFLMNNAAERIVGSPAFASVGLGGKVAFEEDWQSSFCPPPPSVEGNEEIAAPETDLIEEDVVETPSGSGAGNVDAYETNNQEDLVDQADIAKSDGSFIYAAYGSKLLIVNPATGKLVLTLDLPAPECHNVTYGCPGVGVSEDVDIGGNTTNGDTGQPPAQPPNATGVDAEVVVALPNASDVPALPPPDSGGYHTYCPQVTIQSILLDANNSRMALIVSGYNDEMRDNATTPILSDFLATQIRLYSTEALVKNGGGVGLLGIQNINGYYRQGYIMEEDGIAHIATSTMVNSWDALVKPLEQLKDQSVAGDATNETEYFRAVRNARAGILEGFVNQTLAELAVSTGDIPRMAPIWLPIAEASDVSGFEQVLLGEGYANQMIQITSFDMAGDPVVADNTTVGEIEVSQTVQFLPNSYGEVYAAEDMIVMTGSGFHFVEGIGGSEDMTMIYAYAIEDMMTTPVATGKVPGHLLNRYSLDYHDGLFRAATTTQTWFVDDLVLNDTVAKDGNAGSENEINVRRLQVDEPGNFALLASCPDTVDECFTNETLARCVAISEGGCTSIAYSNTTCPGALSCIDDFTESQCPTPSTNETNPCLNAENLQACLDLVDSGCKEIAILESCPLQFSCATAVPDIGDPPTSSSTKNQIFVLEPPPEGEAEMVIVGNVTLGKPNEVFTAVRFFDEIAYAVTFLRTDPFYAISFEEDSKSPVVLGELQISGFSNYMHSINENNTMILALGMETDVGGAETGLKLSLFDVTNKTAPSEVSKYVLSGSDSWSGSSAQSDFLAFRYVYLSEEEGRIIVPVYYSNATSAEFFDGFKVFSLSPAGIFPLFDISHNVDNVFIRKLIDLSEPDTCSCGYLLDRSFVIDGDVITLKGQSARSHTVDTGEEVWGLNFAGSAFCCST